MPTSAVGSSPEGLIRVPSSRGQALLLALGKPLSVNDRPWRTQDASVRALRASPARTWPAQATPRQAGFTLIELMVVVAIIAIGSAGVMFALRDSAASQLEREGLRLAAMLESARAQSRSSGQALRWRPVEGGFIVESTAGLAAASSTAPNPSANAPRTSRWLSQDTRVQGKPELVLGPEPLLPPQSVLIESVALPGRPVQVATDGLHPFRVGAPGAPP